ncbi:hypothetical protein PIROE2DRAFT_15076 [Piromyces sp. E2]|nr:hypothetical protein PIROE2DRAFT_15076 [Piromyces sp. E2]|eukprot:OUM59415.1 hypothetical protein PIROE2DRAFT_15076 [Piromyces sp. E2]
MSIRLFYGVKGNPFIIGIVYIKQYSVKVLTLLPLQDINYIELLFNEIWNGEFPDV